jgi:hypothetical protein
MQLKKRTTQKENRLTEVIGLRCILSLCGRGADNWLVMNFNLLGVPLNATKIMNFGFHVKFGLEFVGQQRRPAIIAYGTVLTTVLALNCASTTEQHVISRHVQ